jgi:hypothetical protein
VTAPSKGRAFLEIISTSSLIGRVTMNHASIVRRVAASMFLAAGAALSGCAQSSGASGQRVFSTPEKAVADLERAARAGDTAELIAIFGPDGRGVISSGDPVADRLQREVFTVAMDQGWQVRNSGDRTKEIVIGDENWPFPIPLVKDGSGWRFDTKSGADEILARRIGRNELAAIGVMQLAVVAQREYASGVHDGKGPGIYARNIRSAAGTQNGLYWPANNPGDTPSPLGDLAAEAESEGYSVEGHDGPIPFRGYSYRILTGQGSQAPGGAMEYIVDGEMRRGFALIAFPVEYGNSGIMTFIVNQSGLIFEADLGEDTGAIADSITRYDPDDRWDLVD